MLWKKIFSNSMSHDISLLRQFSKFWFRIWIILYKETLQALVQVSVAKMNFCCGKLKENKKTVWQKWFYEIMFEGPQREESNYVLGWRLQANHIEHSSTEHTTFLWGTPPPTLPLGTAWRRIRACCTWKAFWTFPCLSGKVDYSATK